jgi:hypothetical protein
VFEQEPSVSVSTARFMSGCPNPEMDPVLTRPDSGTEAAVQTDHMIGVSDTFADMADAVLVLENTEFPVHKNILAANSKVFAEAFTAASREADQTDPSGKVSVCLYGDSLSEISTVLTYLYKGCLFGGTPDLDCLEDIKVLVKVAHKYSMLSVISVCEIQLIAKLQEMKNDDEWVLFCDNEAVVSWTEFAEQFSLVTFLAHCEAFMIKDNDATLWFDPAMKADRISRGCLLRVLYGQQMYRKNMRADSQARSRSAFAVRPDLDISISQLLECRNL